MYKDKRKWSIRLAIVVLLAGALIGGLYYFNRTYTVKTVYVEGSFHYTSEEIQNMVMDGMFGDNSLYLSIKYKNKDVQDIPFVDVMNVSVLSPDTIKITVYEKALAGYVKYLDSYVYFDKDGYVVETSALKTEGIPQITGLDFDYVVLGKALPVEHPEIFSDILSITKLLNKYALKADKIHFKNTKDIVLYFDEVKVALGNESNYLEDKIMLLPTFLENLEGKQGTLNMEIYDGKNGKYTFHKENL